MTICYKITKIKTRNLQILIKGIKVKKKTKIVAIMLSLCMSVSMLTIGVLAASQVSLNVSSSVSFQSTGAYIMATGQVKRGTETSLANLTEEDRPAGDTGTGLSYSYTGYSYTPIGSGSDVNAPDGSGSKDLATWNIGSIEFLESESVVQYEITFKNYGEADVTSNNSNKRTNGSIYINFNVNKV